MNINHSQAPLWQALCRQARSNQVPFYTPGHKRGRGLPAAVLQHLGTGVGLMDLPELPGLDNLFAPESVIQEAQELAADLWGAEYTWFLTNGSTSGVLAAILATCSPGDTILVPRNIHISVISGLVLSGAHPIFLQPDLDAELGLAHCVAPAALQRALEQYPGVKAVLVVYPTYEGICGDLGAIASVTHTYGIPLLVDAAHGPHLAFHPDLPCAALAAGADIVVQSTHKLLGALTQAAMLHAQGPLIDPLRVSQGIQLVQSTSPNYILLASLDATRHQMAEQGRALMEQVLALAAQMRSHLQTLSGYQEPTCSLPGCRAMDQTRFTISTTLFGGSGYHLDRLLIDQYGVTAELVTPRYLTFLMTFGNSRQDIDRLYQALHQLYQPSSLPSAPDLISKPALSIPPLSPRDVYWGPTVSVPWAEALDRISAESICPYPPGIPILFPGEKIEAQDLHYLQQVQESGGVITGCSCPSLQTLRVVRE